MNIPEIIYTERKTLNVDMDKRSMSATVGWEDFFNRYFSPATAAILSEYELLKEKNPEWRRITDFTIESNEKTYTLKLEIGIFDKKATETAAKKFMEQI